MVFTRWTASARRDVRCHRVNYAVKERGGQGRLQTGSLRGVGGGGKGGMTASLTWRLRRRQGPPPSMNSSATACAPSPALITTLLHFS